MINKKIILNKLIISEYNHLDNEKKDTSNLRRIRYSSKFYRNKSDQTLLGVEVPSTKNKLYPFPTKSDQALADKYFENMPKNIFFMGRAGAYRYIDMDDIVGQGFDLLKKI